MEKKLKIFVIEPIRLFNHVNFVQNVTFETLLIFIINKDCPVILLYSKI